MRGRRNSLNKTVHLDSYCPRGEADFLTSRALKHAPETTAMNSAL